MSRVHHLLFGLLGAGLGVACHSLGADPDGLGTIGHADKWHDHGPTTWDHDFVASHEHYALLGSTSSRLGQVMCP